MEINLDICKAVAVQHGMPLQFVIKEFHLFDVLSQITAATMQSETKLVFKGGTALNKVYLKKGQRFSEDIDFDVDYEDSYNFSKELAKKIDGYSITDFRKVRNTTMFFCIYNSPLGRKDHIRVDIVKKKILTANHLQVKSAVSDLTNISVSGFYVYSLEDLVARKMSALCSRTEGKDVYDVHSSLPLCKEMGKAIGIMLKSEEDDRSAANFIVDTVNAVKMVDYKKLRNLTNPFIPLSYRPTNWLELKNDLIFKLENLKV